MCSCDLNNVRRSRNLANKSIANINHFTINHTALVVALIYHYFSLSSLFGVRGAGTGTGSRLHQGQGNSSPDPERTAITEIDQSGSLQPVVGA